MSETVFAKIPIKNYSSQVAWSGAQFRFGINGRNKKIQYVEPISKQIKSDELIGAISARKPYNILINKEECAIWVLH